MIKLPKPNYESETSVEKALLERRSVRDYKDTALQLSEISQLLWSAQGITAANAPGMPGDTTSAHTGVASLTVLARPSLWGGASVDPKDRTLTEKRDGKRTAPSAGATYPLDVYVVSGKVNDLPCGIYKYNPERHELLKIIEGDKRAELCNSAFGQSSVGNAPAVLVFSAVYKRTTFRYGERGNRYVHMEVGHAGQNVHLQAVSLNLGTVVIGAFNDSQVKKVINMQEEEEPLYLMPIGRVK